MALDMDGRLNSGTRVEDLGRGDGRLIGEEGERAAGV